MTETPENAPRGPARPSSDAPSPDTQGPGAPGSDNRRPQQPAGGHQGRKSGARGQSLDRIRDPRQLRDLGNKLLGAGRAPEAIATFEALLARHPEDAGSWSNLGVALRKLALFPAAEVAYRRALELRPGNAAFLGNLANVLKDMDRLEESIEAHEQAIAASPDEYLLIFNHGLALREASRFEEALAVFDACVAHEPANAKYQWDRALALLHLGRMKEGWEAYDWRWRIGELPEPRYDAPRWRGETLEGKSILLFPEQGFGDTILATRFLPLLKAAGAREVILEVKPPLRRLFAELEGVDSMIEPGSRMAGFDYHCSLMDLPGRFAAGAGPLPPLPRLHVPQAARDKIAPLVARANDRFKVGVIWSGSVTFKNNRKRAVRAERFLDLARLPGLQLYSLQMGPTQPQLQEIGGGAAMLDLARHIEDFAETAAAIEALDLVIMTDSAVAHLVGALGRPIWNLLNYTPYWVYAQDGGTASWYPSMRLFRQERPSEWDPVFAAVEAALRDAIAAKRAGHWPPAPKNA